VSICLTADAIHNGVLLANNQTANFNDHQSSPVTIQLLVLQSILCLH